MFFTFIIVCTFLSSVAGLKRAGTNHSLFTDKGVESFSSSENLIFYAAKPASLAVMMPFNLKSADLVIAAVQQWSAAGDPCPFIRANSGTASSVDLVFWFENDLLKDASMFANFKSEAQKAMGDNGACFRKVKFLSAMVTPDQNFNTFGSTLHWYNAFLNHTPRLTGVYDFMFWHGEDVLAIRPGFLDKLLHEVTYKNNFYVKGSIHRGPFSDIEKLKPWTGNIDINAIYNMKDKNYLNIIRKVQTLSSHPKYEHASAVDVGMWSETVTNFMSNWDNYQRTAHKFVYSDFIQSYGSKIDGKLLDEILASSPNTYLVRGSCTVIGQTGRSVAVIEASLKEGHTGSVGMAIPPAGIRRDVIMKRLRTFQSHGIEKTLPTAAGEKIGVVLLLNPNEINGVKILFGLIGDSNYSPCTGEYKKDIDLVLFISSGWSEQYLKQIRGIISDFDSSLSCFKQIRFVEGNIDKMESTAITGPANKHFRSMFSNIRISERYNYVLMLTLDTLPIRSGWLDGLYNEINLKSTEFWMKGSAYTGFREDSLAYDYGFHDLSSTWASMGPSGIYNVQSPDFTAFLDKAMNTYPNIPFNVAIQIFLSYNKHFADSKIALPRISFSSFVQNFHGTQYNIDTLVSKSPDTYLVSSTCRKEYYDPQLYCKVCDVKDEWSATCQIKLNSKDPNRGYDRFTTGPTYSGIPISSGNSQQIAAAAILL